MIPSGGTDAEVVIVNGMPNWRSDDGHNERCLHRIEAWRPL
ncbi:MAG: hypothetical protein QF844_02495 [Acidimicrobiales bacterium]|nr:hypothetical protein [Acidimicrobiales bacterium]MEE3352823.1 hypothetical protein [Actinomycetota bacterium]